MYLLYGSLRFVSEGSEIQTSEYTPLKLALQLNYERTHLPLQLRKDLFIYR
jgi:hypothetical protein